MKKTYMIIIIILTTIIISRYIELTIYKHEYYYNKYLEVSNKIVYGLNAPRGRILDRNGKVLVDNIGINTIVFHQTGETDIKEISILLNEIIDVSPASIEEQKKYYLKFEDTSNLLTQEEQELLKKRKLTIKDVERIKLNRINPNYSEKEQKIITIYNLLTKGYSYDSKIVKEDVTDEICSIINTKNIILAVRYFFFITVIFYNPFTIKVIQSHLIKNFMK